MQEKDIQAINILFEKLKQELKDKNELTLEKIEELELKKSKIIQEMQDKGDHTYESSDYADLRKQKEREIYQGETEDNVKETETYATDSIDIQEMLRKRMEAKKRIISP